MLAGLELNGVELFRISLMAKDSNDMTASDHLIAGDSSDALSEITMALWWFTEQIDSRRRAKK